MIWEWNQEVEASTPLILLPGLVVPHMVSVTVRSGTASGTISLV